MIRPLLLALLLAPPSLAEPSTPWAGVPLAALPALGLGTPDLDTWSSGWRATLPKDGFVRLMLRDGVEEARALFAQQIRTAATVPPPPLVWVAPEGREVEAAGDGVGFLVLRDGNVVLVVRDSRGQAAAVGRALEDALVTEAPAAPPAERRLPGRVLRWDSCGRLLP